MSGFYSDLKAAGIKYIKDFSLKEKANFRIGGKAECYLKAENTVALAGVVKAAGAAKKEMFVMGNLTNVLISDGKLKKVFIELKGDFTAVRSEGVVRVFAGAGAKMNAVLGFLIRKGLKGMEFMAGIPGTVGGAVYMNAGAFGKSISPLITRVYYMDKKGKCGVLTDIKKGFSYRHSVFQENGFIITGAEFKLKKGKPAEIKKEMAEIIKQRHAKHPWKAYCAGSFFKNGKDYTAGKLIEQAGFKGRKVGGAKISEMHGNFLINDTGKASCKDVMKLAAIVKKEVYKKFKVRLEEEVRVIK